MCSCLHQHDLKNIGNIRTVNCELFNHLTFYISSSSSSPPRLSLSPLYVLHNVCPLTIIRFIQQPSISTTCCKTSQLKSPLETSSFACLPSKHQTSDISPSDTTKQASKSSLSFLFIKMVSGLLALSTYLFVN